MLKYNYVVLGSDWDLYKFSYSDLQDVNFAEYIAGNYPSKNSIKGVFYRLHFNSTINKFLNLPLKKCWNNSYLKFQFDSDKRICFVVFNNWICLNVDIVQHLRKKYPGCKVVWICQDLISTQRLKFTKEKFDVYELKKQFDLVLSFDHGDCQRYGFVYHPLVFSSFKGKKENLPESDIYMLAQAKNRLGEIYDVYEILKEQGLKTDFHLVGVKAEDQKFKDDIHFLDKAGMTYAQNIQHILHSKCILEVMQKNGTGFTQRGCEAVCLGKKLLTNNKHMVSEAFYRSEYISIFSSSKDIDLNFITHIKDDVCVDYNYKEKMSPKELLTFIEDRL